MSILFRAYPLARSILFSMDPERAHEVTLGMLQRAYDFAPTRALMSAQVPDPITLMGLRLPNPVGLAAGLDKNGAHIDALGSLGFGFVEVGTVRTPCVRGGIETDQSVASASDGPRLAHATRPTAQVITPSTV